MTLRTQEVFDGALVLFEIVCGQSFAEVWFASLDLTKACVQVEHGQFCEELRENHPSETLRVFGGGDEQN